MPEGPSVVLLKEEVQQFMGAQIIAVKGNSKIDQGRLVNRSILSFKAGENIFLYALRISPYGFIF